MKSLRVRLVTWYLTVGAIIVVGVGLLGSIAALEAASFEARQSLADSARQAPALVELYRSKHHDLDGVDEFLSARFAQRGVVAHIITATRFMHVTLPPPPPGSKNAFFPGPPPERGSILYVQRGDFGTTTRGETGIITTRGETGITTRGPFAGPMPFPGKQVPRERPPLFVGLLSMAIKPVTASFPGGDVVLFVDPNSFKGLFSVLGAFVLIMALVILPAAWRIAVTVAESTLEPLLRTTNALNRFGSGDFTPEVVSTRDRSELGELASAYNSAVEQITRAFEERSKTEAEMRQFVADAGHQLRTPLTVIMGYLSGMAQRAESARQATTYNTMLAQARRMKSLIDDLITLARLEHPSAHESQYTDLNALCTRLPLNFSQEDQHRINVRAATTAAVVDANETDLSGALSALIDNALNYAPGSEVDVTLVQDNAHWVVSVADRGPGMTGDDLRGAFDRFYRGSAAEGVEGTGLGLPIVRKSVERMGGTILLCNRVDGGLLVTIRIPKAHVIVAEAQ